MATYTVQDTTMTALGDAVRKQTVKYIGKEEKSEPFFTYHFDSKDYDLVSGWNTIYFNPLNEYLEEITDIFQVCEGHFTYTANTSPSPCIYISMPTQPNGNSHGAINFIINNSNETNIEVIDDYSTIRFYYDTDWQLYIIMDSEVPSDIDFSFDFELRAMTEDNEYIGLNTYTTAEMIDTINSWDLSAIERYKYRIIAGTQLDVQNGRAKFYSIPSSDFSGISQIGNKAFSEMYCIKGIEIPEGITEIRNQAFADCSNLTGDIILPSTLTFLGGRAFSSTFITSVRILNDTTLLTYDTLASSASTWSPFYNCNQLTNIYVPSRLYPDYTNSILGEYHLSLLTPYGEWVFDPNIYKYLLYNQTETISIELLDFEETPTVSVVSDNTNIATISNITINEDNTLLTFDVTSLSTDGTANISIEISGTNQYSFVGTVNVMETIPEPTYEVVAVDGATYGFALNDSGYYESQNKNINSSYSLCQINISNLKGVPVYIDCISYGESNYDYGLLGSVNQTLSKTTADDSGVKKNFKGLSSTNIQTVEYTDANGDFFIQVKYKKDGSGNQGNDTLQFQVRFGE